MTVPRHQQAAEVVRAQIADGTLKPGAAAPSGSALARVTGFSVLTCRRALRTLISAGVLVPGASPNARAHVADPAAPGSGTADAAAALSAALAGRRRAAGRTQAELAELAGCSLTTIGHAETGRLWQSRRFWETADRVLSARGELLRLHDAYRTTAARSASGHHPSREQHMTQQPAPGRIYLDHSAVITARMPTPDERADGYPAGVPVLVVTRPGGELATGTYGPQVKVFSAASAALEIGDPEGAPDAEAMADAASYVFAVIAEELGNVGARIAALAAAARRSPGSITRLADDYRRERVMETFCEDVESCEHATRAAAELDLISQITSASGSAALAAT